LNRVIESAAFINGPEVKAFQSELETYLGVKHVIPCANGTDALQIALMALGLQPGDEVITSNFTFVATVEVVALLGIKPVLVDVDPDTFNLIPEQVEAAITPKTKAIVPVHLFGQCADMDAFLAIGKKHGIPIVEDNAQAIGSRFRSTDGNTYMSGTMGEIGCTSFFPSKNLGCFGDGGAVFTQSDELAGRIRMMANHGQRERYYYDEVGVNSRLDSLQAAILRIKLRNLDSYAQARNKAAAYYDKAFAGNPHIQTPARFGKSDHVFHQYTLKLNGVDRKEMQAFLQSKGIPAMVYYPVPLHAHKAYANLGLRDEDFPNTVDLCSRVISLPMHTELDEEQLSYITSQVLAFTAQS
ncbi:MAG: DegT/DnrJ/EryC1/StrS family aminotransferase, partial [Flavobacteriales bacterium]|nr:DegT/DnrJ/EryC1/StrS family aminotransferase [Flavobacteriales bacterium]